VIERVLGALDALTRRPVVESLGDWKKALDFIRHFADECHHFKEEQVLFPAMEEHGIPKEGGPIGMMLIEHEEGRGYVRDMAAAIALAVFGFASEKDSATCASIIRRSAAAKKR
jgi:hemerythrin-like domain-containing protein